jgi:hypothetical protein
LNRSGFFVTASCNTFCKILVEIKIGELQIMKN